MTAHAAHGTYRQGFLSRFGGDRGGASQGRDGGVRRSLRGSRAGMTLVEVTVGFLIILIASLMFAAIFTGMNRMSLWAQEIDRDDDSLLTAAAGVRAVGGVVVESGQAVLDLGDGYYVPLLFSKIKVAESGREMVVFGYEETS